MSDSNRINLAYGLEASYAGALAVAKITDLNYSSESLAAVLATTMSQHIRSDRQNADVVRTNFAAGGQIAGELHYGGYDEFILGGLMASAFGAQQAVITASVQVAISGGAFELGVGSWTNVPAAGEWIEVRGNDTAGNNGYFKVASSDSNTITPENAAGLVNEVAGSSVTIKRFGSAVQGTTFKHFTIERTYEELSNEFAVFKGMTVGRFGLNFEVGNISKVEFDFLGKSEASGSATVGDGANTAAATTQSLNSIDHVPLVLSNGVAFNILAFNVDVNNKLREQPIIGTLGPNSIGAGAVDVTGSFRAYYSSKTEADRMLNFTTSNLAIVTEDSAGNAMVWDIPAIKLTDAKRVSGGRDTDCIMDVQWMAFRDSAEDATIRIGKMDA